MSNKLLDDAKKISSLRETKQSHLNNRELLGIAASIFAYVALISSGPSSSAGVVVKSLPVLLLFLCMYLLICTVISHKAGSRLCFFSDFFEQNSANLTVWMLLWCLLVGCQQRFNWSGEVLSFFYIGGLLANSDGGKF